jgi:hypothetical protein
VQEDKESICSERFHRYGFGQLQINNKKRKRGKRHEEEYLRSNGSSIGSRRYGRLRQQCKDSSNHSSPDDGSRDNRS